MPEYVKKIDSFLWNRGYADTECLMHCWQLPEQKVKQELVLRNKKYCFLYPFDRNPVGKKPKPPPRYASLYTNWDYRLEKCTQEQIIKLEDQFRAYEKLLNKEIELQRMLIDRMWELSYRYWLLTASVPCVRPYPEITSQPEESLTLCEFNNKLLALKVSNARLAKPLINMKASVKELGARVAQLDTTLNTSILINGDVRNKPLKYVCNLIADMYKCCHNIAHKFNIWAELIDVHIPMSVADYQTLLRHSANAEDINEKLMPRYKSCKCLRSRKTELLMKNVTCRRK